MKSLLLATITAIGIGLLGVPAASAAPMSGAVIGQTVAADPLTQEVYWRYRYRHWHCWWHRGHRHCHR